MVSVFFFSQSWNVSYRKIPAKYFQSINSNMSFIILGILYTKWQTSGNKYKQTSSTRFSSILDEGVFLPFAFSSDFSFAHWYLQFSLWFWFPILYTVFLFFLCQTRNHQCDARINWRHFSTPFDLLDYILSG